MSVGILSLDVAGRILAANATAGRILGIAAAACVGRAIDDVLAPLARLRAGDAVALELRRPAGASRVRARLTALAEPPRYLCELEPLSGDSRTEHLQLDVLRQVVPALLHELRNPLAGIAALVEILLEEVPPTQRGDLLAVQGEIRRMVMSMQGIGLLDHPLRLPAGSVAELGPVLTDTLESLRVLAERRRVRVTAQLALPRPLDLSPIVLGAILFNLVDNAIAACRAGQSVRVAAEAPGARSLELSVTDDGQGMSEEALARCTEPLFTTKANGTGLGLALVARAVQGAGGTLSITSAPRAGTRVVLQVPISPQPEEEESSCLVSNC